jgi:hypothetical protein
MSHIIDVSGTYESLFQLRHLACGSREYCRRELLHFGDDDYTPEEWDTHQSQLHFLVSKALINCAINFRVLQDTLRSQSSARDLSEAERDLALDQHPELGEVLEGKLMLTLRESANKIIHATSFDLEFFEARTGKPAKKYSYWGGFVYAVGTQGAQRWRIRLDTFNWCTAVDTYVQCLAGDLEWR